MIDRPNDRPDARQARRLKPRAAPRPAGEQVPQPDRQVAFRLGISAESRAAAFLIAKGFRILARRWKSPVGEIDIVARRRSLLVFVEVKARAQLDDAAWSETDRQRARIVAAAEAWLAANADSRIRDIPSTPCWWRRAASRSTFRRRSTPGDETGRTYPQDGRELSGQWESGYRRYRFVSGGD